MKFQGIECAISRNLEWVRGELVFVVKIGHLLDNSIVEPDASASSYYGISFTR